MAVSVHSSIAADARPRTSFTMSLITGWDQIPPGCGGRTPCAGDLIVLEVRKPETDVTGPPGWTLLGELPWTDEEGREHTGAAFWKIIGPPEKEIPPMFSAPGEPEWEIRGQALTGYAPIGDGSTGSTASSPLPL